MTRTIRITAPHFVAGAVYDTTTRRCLMTAPILHWMKRMSPEEAIAYIKRKGWEFEWLPEE